MPVRFAIKIALERQRERERERGEERKQEAKQHTTNRCEMLVRSSETSGPSKNTLKRLARLLVVDN